MVKYEAKLGGRSNFHPYLTRINDSNIDKPFENLFDKRIRQRHRSTIKNKIFLFVLIIIDLSMI